MKPEVNEQAEQLFQLILKKSGMKYEDFLFLVKHNFVAANLDCLTEREKKRFNIKIKDEEKQRHSKKNIC